MLESLVVVEDNEGNGWTVRPAASAALVSLLRLLPARDLDADIARVLGKIANCLRSRAQGVRDTARAALALAAKGETGPHTTAFARCTPFLEDFLSSPGTSAPARPLRRSRPMKRTRHRKLTNRIPSRRPVVVPSSKGLGCAKLPTLVRLLASRLDRGFMTHVLGATLHALVDACVPGADPEDATDALEAIMPLLDEDVFGRAAEARSISHWFPYDRVGVVNADP